MLAIRQYRFPENYLGQDLITTDGTTLLGADDKAGIAEISPPWNNFRRFTPRSPWRCLGRLYPDEGDGARCRPLPLERFPAKWAHGGWRRARRARMRELQRRQRHGAHHRQQRPPRHRQRRP